MVVATFHSLPPINFISVYNPPLNTTMFTNDLEKLISYNSSTFIAGDFNAKNRQWNCSSTCRLGKHLLNFVKITKQILLTPETPTRISTTGASILDFAITRNVNYLSTVRAENELSSDHLPVRFWLDAATDPHHLQTFITNWKKYQQHIIANSTIDFCPLKFEDIEKEIARFTNEHLEAVKASDPRDKILLNRAHSYLRKPHYEANQRRETNKITLFNPSDGSIWRQVKNYTKTYSKIPPLLTPRTIVYTNHEKAEAIADVLENLFKTNDLSHPPPNDNLVKRKLNKFFKKKKPDNSFTPCTPSEIAEFIEKLKKGKSPGKDGITNLMIKRMPIKSIFRLTEFINSILKFQYFSNHWKTAIVAPILKPGKNPREPNSYRPISLLSSLSKIADAVILKRLTEATEDRIIPFQFGFRKNLSTVQQLLRITEVMREGMDEGWDTGAVFLDIAKAFDRVWTDGLVYKLIELRVPGSIIRFIATYLSTR
ncbi:putative RNA-directed DNA polymerase from transposon X-element [Araneus ventricosus]|uniref:Putative RNA-directed DNA polymerase from transposon X-element n=1 Tax=Araneus ventricosus TaxID=182803 RepID=A0A4Y2WFM7_ARAVE|nr:putative RNA-directed DNA polymerase from transposon X-element [Araneus ventricosus]